MFYGNVKISRLKSEWNISGCEIRQNITEIAKSFEYAL